MARRRGSARRRRRGGSGFLYKLLSVFLICGCLVAAITLFFRVDTVVITGEKRYTEAEIRQASGSPHSCTWISRVSGSFRWMWVFSISI